MKRHGISPFGANAVEVIEAIVERNRPLASQADARSLRRTCNGPGGGATGAVEEGLVCQSSDGWAFGCDVCNEVCPWNVKFAEPTPFPDLLPRPETDLAGLPEDHFARMSDEEFAGRYGGTAFSRPGRAGMDRNLRAARRLGGPAVGASIPGAGHGALPGTPPPGPRHA